MNIIYKFLKQHQQSARLLLAHQTYLLGLTMLVSCGSPSTEKKTIVHHDEAIDVVEMTAGQMKLAGVSFGKIALRSISGAIKASGLLDVPPQQIASVSVPFGGFVKSTSMLQGSKVRKGQLIAVIENTEYIQLQQDYLEAVNQLEFTKADYERQQRLSEENINAQKTLQQAKASYQNWLARRNGLQARLKMLNIDVNGVEKGNITGSVNVYSPLDGFVTEVNVNIGKYVNPTDVLFQIVDTEHLHAELTIFEKDIPKVRIGQKVRFTLANESRERTAVVYLIGRQIGADRTIRIHCHIDSEDTNLLPGTYLQAFIEAGELEVSALPDEAIVEFQNKKYLFVREGSHPADADTVANSEARFKMMEVNTGNREAGYTEILLPADWNSENAVVVKGAYAILSKAKNNEAEE
jgi:cobalt-zinc-cadmium efflux system membrane fusion protein